MRLVQGTVLPDTVCPLLARARHSHPRNKDGLLTQRDIQGHTESQGPPFVNDHQNKTIPRVSVIIPTRNRAAHFLSRAIRSVLSQTWRDLELIVIDDASDDGTEQVIKAIGDPRVRHLQHTTALGPGAARNSGVKLARGEFVAFLDDDDEWLPNKLEKQLWLFDKCPELGLVYSGWSWICHKTGATQFVRIPKRDGLICGMPRWAHNVVVDFVARKELCLRVPFAEGLRYMENSDVLIQLAQICRFGYLEEITVRCTSHNGARSSDSAVDRERDIEYILISHESFLKTFPKVWAWYNLKLGVLCLRHSGRRHTSRRAFKAAAMSNPLSGKAWAYLILSLAPHCVVRRLLLVR